MRTKVLSTDEINAIPPVPGPAASHAPRRTGLLGTNYVMCVDRDAMVLVSHRIRMIIVNIDIQYLYEE